MKIKCLENNKIYDIGNDLQIEDFEISMIIDKVAGDEFCYNDEHKNEKGQANGIYTIKSTEMMEKIIKKIDNYTYDNPPPIMPKIGKDGYWIEH